MFDAFIELLDLFYKTDEANLNMFRFLASVADEDQSQL